MACYDVTAELTMTVIIERQADACNALVAENDARDALARYAPTLPDGAVYSVDVSHVTVKKRS